MAEEFLVISESLSNEKRNAGRALIDSLDKNVVNITDAFWVYIQEEGLWRLCLATTQADTDGPLAIYRTIRQLLYEMPGEVRDALDLSDIAVISPHMLEVSNLRHRYGAVEHEDNRRVRRVDSPYLYRLAAL